MKIWSFKLNGKVKWEELELYNDVTRQVARDQEVFLIDLAKALPKSTEYFYDYVHYTNAGSEKVAELVNRQLTPWLTEKYPRFRRAE